MSKSDRMFEELGFVKDYEYENDILYICKYPTGRDVLSIEFSNGKGYIYFSSDIENMISFDLLSAINEKLKELGVM